MPGFAINWSATEMTKFGQPRRAHVSVISCQVQPYDIYIIVKESNDNVHTYNPIKTQGWTHMLTKYTHIILCTHMI